MQHQWSGKEDNPQLCGQGFIREQATALPLCEVVPTAIQEEARFSSLELLRELWTERSLILP